MKGTNGDVKDSPALDGDDLARRMIQYFTTDIKRILWTAILLFCRPRLFYLLWCLPIVAYILFQFYEATIVGFGLLHDFLDGHSLSHALKRMRMLGDRFPRLSSYTALRTILVKSLLPHYGSRPLTRSEGGNGQTKDSLCSVDNPHHSLHDFNLPNSVPWELSQFGKVRERTSNLPGSWHVSRKLLHLAADILNAYHLGISLNMNDTKDESSTVVHKQNAYIPSIAESSPELSDKDMLSGLDVPTQDHDNTSRSGAEQAHRPECPKSESKDIDDSKHGVSSIVTAPEHSPVCGQELLMDVVVEEKDSTSMQDIEEIFDNPYREPTVPACDPHVIAVKLADLPDVPCSPTTSANVITSEVDTAVDANVEWSRFEVNRSNADDLRRTSRQLEVPGRLGPLQVTAIPDFGSSFNIISDSTALLLESNIDTHNARQFGLPNGASGSFLGTIEIPWSFSGEEDQAWTRVFHVLKNCVHPVMLGREFLIETETLSKHLHRVTEKILESLTIPRRLLFVDTPAERATSRERILGLINGRPIGGLADTCSDFTIIKRSAAKKLGLAILEGEDHTTEVQFVDGSTAFTTGMIPNVRWCFSVTLAESDIHTVDVHVMDDIPCAFILDRWLLWDNRAFLNYQDSFIDIGQCNIHACDPVCLITEVKESKIGAAIGRMFHPPQNPVAGSANIQPIQPSHTSPQEEARTRGAAKDRIRSITNETDRRAAQIEEDERIRLWNSFNSIFLANRSKATGNVASGIATGAAPGNSPVTTTAIPSSVSGPTNLIPAAGPSSAPQASSSGKKKRKSKTKARKGKRSYIPECIASLREVKD
ncbi:hypothetical protein NX059_003127 [Plenodomus lindquistii]|nr:hypothetical protein NX059_003127 [Plenodomus lindquistii]